MTFSLAGRCARAGNFGIVISSSSPAVAARCAHLAPGIGAACSQNITDPRLGSELLHELRQGSSSRRAMSRVTRGRDDIDYRQLTVIDATGNTAVHSGANVLGTHSSSQGQDAVAA